MQSYIHATTKVPRTNRILYTVRHPDGSDSLEDHISVQRYYPGALAAYVNLHRTADYALAADRAESSGHGDHLTGNVADDDSSLGNRVKSSGHGDHLSSINVAIDIPSLPTTATHDTTRSPSLGRQYHDSAFDRPTEAISITTRLDVLANVAGKEGSQWRNGLSSCPANHVSHKCLVMDDPPLSPPPSFETEDICGIIKNPDRKSVV